MSGQVLRVPSVEFFEALGDRMDQDRETHRRIGEVDLSCIWTFFDTSEGDRHFRLRFEEFSLVEVNEVNDDFDPDSVDFILEGDALDWAEMFDQIHQHGRPGREFTLNFLSLPGTPLRCWSPDPLGRDVFFRFNQSLQVYVNGAAKVAQLDTDRAEV